MYVLLENWEAERDSWEKKSTCNGTGCPLVIERLIFSERLACCLRRVSRSVASCRRILAFERRTKVCRARAAISTLSWWRTEIGYPEILPERPRFSSSVSIELLFSNHPLRASRAQLWSKINIVYHFSPSRLWANDLYPNRPRQIQKLIMEF